MSKWLVLGIFALAFLLRTVFLGDFPAGFSADEVNQGYTAYSILKTGRDEWGDAFPIAPRSYGDFRAPLYTYLTIPFVAIFGLSEFAVRFPNALVGTLAVIVSYLLSREIFKSLSPRIAILASFLLAISPWHIMLSRGAFETNLPTLFIPAGVLFFILGERKRKFMVLAAISFGLGLFAYYSSRFLIPLIVILLFVVPKKSLLYYIQKYSIALTFFAAFSALAVFTLFIGSGTRISDVVIFSSDAFVKNVSDARYEAVMLGMPDEFSRIFSNKLVYTLETVFKNYLSYFSFQFLFTNGAGEATYGMAPGIGLLYPIEIVFLAFSAFYIVLKKLYKEPYVLVSILILILAPIPASLSSGPGFAANRAALMMPWIQLLSAFGGLALLEKFRKKYALILLTFYFIFSAIFFLEDYFFHSPSLNSRQMSYGWKEMSKFLGENKDSYNKVIISRNFSEPQMFLAFYLKYDPVFIQKESQDWLRYESDGLKFVDQLGQYSLADFVFRGININTDIKEKDVLLIGKPEDFPEEIEPLKVVRYPDGKEAIFIVSTKGEL